MPSYDGPHTLAPNGSTGNATHGGLHLGANYGGIVVQFHVTAAGATPTVTYKVQTSIDSTDGVDGNWFDAGYVTDASDTFATAARVRTTVGVDILYLARPAKWIRLVTSANTNITYNAKTWLDRAHAA